MCNLGEPPLLSLKWKFFFARLLWESNDLINEKSFINSQEAYHYFFHIIVTVIISILFDARYSYKYFT